MIDQPELHSNRLKLRSFSLDDIEDVTLLVGDKAVASTTLRIPHPYDRTMAKEWIESHNGGLLLDSGLVYAIVLKNTGQLIGSIGLSIIEEHQRAEMGYWIGKPYWNKGCATEAAGLVLHFGFHNLGLNRINASHLVRNPGSGRVMEKNGMKFEGCFRQHVKKWGVFEDLNYFAILKEDFID